MRLTQGPASHALMASRSEAWFAKWSWRGWQLQESPFHEVLKSFARTRPAPVVAGWGPEACYKRLYADECMRCSDPVLHQVARP
eukprot:5431659-Pyramimonas_sp.AAC.1